MPPRIVRFLRVATLVAVGSGGVFWTWTLLQRVDDAERAGRQSAARIDRLETFLDELARLELLYATSGQLESDAPATANTLLRQLVSDASMLLRESLAGTSPAATALNRETARVAEVAERAQENIGVGLETTAGDLLFTETSRTRRSFRDHLRSLRKAEAEAVANVRASAVEQAWAPLAAVALVFAWALIRSSRAPATAANGSISTTLQPRQSAAENAQPSTREHAIDLVETAAICTAIGRLQSDAGLPVLLERTGRLLEASGVVVWMAAGEELFPVAGYGYDAAQWRQLGPINQSARNATAAAWRSGTLELVGGDSTSRAAIVAPLLGVERCVGVLAVEITPGREQEPAVQAAASLVAAQLAAVLVAWPAASSMAPVDVAPFERASASAS